MWKLDHKEGWAPKHWCLQIVVLEKTFESPLDCKEIKPVNPKGNQPWTFIGRLMLKLKLHELTYWKIPWCWERLRAGGVGVTEDEIVGWHHVLDGHEFEQTLGDREGQGSLGCCSLWRRKESDTPEQLNWTNVQSVSAMAFQMSLPSKRLILWNVFGVWVFYLFA